MAFWERKKKKKERLKIREQHKFLKQAASTFEITFDQKNEFN